MRMRKMVISMDKCLTNVLEMRACVAIQTHTVRYCFFKDKY